MLSSLNYLYVDLSPDAHPLNPQPGASDPVSPTYTSYSVPSPFSSDSSASYPNRSPVSEPFDPMADSDNVQHHSHSMDDYTVEYAPSSSLPVYSDVPYTTTSSDFDLNMLDWSTAEMGVTAKRHPPQPAPPGVHHVQPQYSHYRSMSSQNLPCEIERMKNLAIRIPSSSSVSFHHSAQQSPTIHSPIPIPVPSNAPLHHSPALTSHSPQIIAHPLHQSHVQQQHHHPYYDDVEKWRTSPTTAHHSHYNSQYTHSQSVQATIAQHGYTPLQGDPSQPATLRRTVSDYTANSSNGNLHIKQEEVDLYGSLSSYGSTQHASNLRQRHIFDVSGGSPKPPPILVPMPVHPSAPSPHMQAMPLQPRPPISPYYPTQPSHLQNQLHHLRHQQQTQTQDTTYALHPAEVSAGYDTHIHEHGPLVVDMDYPADVTGNVYEQPVYGTDSGYVEACDPHFVNGCEVANSQKVESGRESDPDDLDLELEEGWGTSSHQGGNNDNQFGNDNHGVEDGNGAAEGGDDADAEGEDDVDAGYSSSTSYALPPALQHNHTIIEPLGCESPLSQDELELDGEDEDELDLESEEDDTRDPEFVFRPRRHTSRSASLSTSYPHVAEARSLRSSRYNPYPSSSYASASPGSSYAEEYANRSPVQSHNQAGYATQHTLRSRRTFSHHTSVSPSLSEPSGSGISIRRRTRLTTTLPIPIPVPNLTKKSRGRRVPTMEDFQGDDDGSIPIPVKGRKKSSGTGPKGMRTYTCDVDGCGKLFARGEHLKRHIRSIHTYEKPHRCPYPGCGKDFSRHDNLGQHMRVHKDYVPPKDGQTGNKT